MADPAVAEGREEGKRASVRAEVLRDAEALAKLLRGHPDGLGEEQLRAALKVAGHKWGVSRLNAARQVLVTGHKGVRLDTVKDGKRTLSRLVPDSSDRLDS